MNPMYLLIAQYGFEGVIDIINIVENKLNPTVADYVALKNKYGTKTGAQYLAEAMAAQSVATTTVTTVQ